MATIDVQVNASDFIGTVDQIVQALEDKERLLRPICIELVPMMHNRIHDLGLASDSSKIGTYKNSYLRIREKNNHSPSKTDVILVLTRKLSNSWGAFSTDKGYCVGFTDDSDSKGVTSLKKIKFAEERFGKKIENLTEDETTYMNERFNELVQQLIDEAGGRD